MSILAKMGDWQVRGFDWAGAEVGGGGAGEGGGRGRRRGRAVAQGRRVVGEARLAAPRSVPRRERTGKTRAGGGSCAGGNVRCPRGPALGKVWRTLYKWPWGSLVVCATAFSQTPSRNWGG